MIHHYRKFLVTALGVVLSFLSYYYSKNQDIQLIIALATSLGVYAVPNRELPQ